MGADLVMLSAVAPLSLSPKSNILPGLVFAGQVKVDVPKVRERYYYPLSAMRWGWLRCGVSPG
jgi:hypothetical protein